MIKRFVLFSCAAILLVGSSQAHAEIKRVSGGDLNELSVENKLESTLSGDADALKALEAAEAEALKGAGQDTGTFAKELKTEQVTDPKELEEKKPKVKRQVYNPRSNVNGIQGRWMPKKVWENDVDNDKANTILQGLDN